MTNEQKKVVTENIDSVMTKMYSDFMSLMNAAQIVNENLNMPESCSILVDFSKTSFRECYKKACGKKLEITK